MQSIGERLEEARKRKGITIREASEATKIRGEYLNSFENSTFDINIPDVYVRGFLRSYSTYLNVNPEKIVADYNTILLGESKDKAAKRDGREFFGRLEIHQPIISSDEEPGESRRREDDAPRESKLRGWFESAVEKIYFWENMDREVLIKGGIAAGVALVLIVALIFVFRGLMNSDQASDEFLAEATESVDRLQTTPVALMGKADVRVEVRQIDPEMPLFFGVIPRGEEREIEVAGTIQINIFGESQNLALRVGGKEYRMPEGKTSIRTTPSKYLE